MTVGELRDRLLRVPEGWNNLTVVYEYSSNWENDYFEEIDLMQIRTVYGMGSAIFKDTPNNMYTVETEVVVLV